MAAELWRLIGNEAHAKVIEAVMERAHKRAEPTLVAEDIIELLEQVKGLEDASRKSLTDEHGLITLQQVEELRPRSTLLDLDKSRGDLARHAVAQSLIDIENLASILQEALDQNAHIIFD